MKIRGTFEDPRNRLIRRMKYTLGRWKTHTTDTSTTTSDKEQADKVEGQS
jgi:hypothetical protein